MVLKLAPAVHARFFFRAMESRARSASTGRARNRSLVLEPLEAAGSDVQF